MMHVLYSFPCLNSNIFSLAPEQLNTLQGILSLDDENNIFKVSGAFSLSTIRGLIRNVFNVPIPGFSLLNYYICWSFKFCSLIISGEGVGGGGKPFE